MSGPPVSAAWTAPPSSSAGSGRGDTAQPPCSSAAPASGGDVARSVSEQGVPPGDSVAGPGENTTYH